MFMKNGLSLILLMIISVSTIAQKIDSNANLYKAKIESYTKMKKTGTTLGIIGGGLTVLGVALVASADWESTIDDYGYETTTTNATGGVGIISLSVGLPMAITGIILRSVGNRKVFEYSKKLENIDVGCFKYGQQKGLTLAIRF